MEFRKMKIEGLIEVKPRIFRDSRGYFFESYQYELFKAGGISEIFVQDNQSFSTKGVLRGLHLQRDQYAQGKLIRVLSGKVLDVAVDVRKGSPTFGQWESIVLDSQQNNMFYVPPGFLHGFISLEDTLFSYKCTNVYHKESEAGVRWDDPDLAIDWGIQKPIVSEKDRLLPFFREWAK